MAEAVAIAAGTTSVDLPHYQAAIEAT